MTQKNNLELSQTQVANLAQKGKALHQQGNFAEAQVVYEQILKIQPDHFDALQLLGVLFAQIKKYSQAVEFLSRALEINPNYAVAYSNRGIALKELKRFDEALANYDQAIAINTGYLDAHSNRGNVLQELKRFDEALNSYDQAIKINPDYAEAYYNRGNVLQELKRFDEALNSYDQAIKINPDYAVAYYNHGTILQELKRFDEALNSYDQAIKINPDYANAHWNASICNLIKGNFIDGWQGYEWRWRHFQCDSEPLESTKPLWGYQKTNQRLLVWSEQGVGDQIFFGSLLSELLEDVPNLLVQVDKRLIPIFSRSLPKIKFYADDIKLPESDYDVHIPIGSLGKYLRNEEEDFLQSKNNFLLSDQKRTQKIRQELSLPKKLICGISWKSQNEKTGVRRSLPLEKLATIFDPEKICLVNLQYGDISEDIDTLKLKTNMELIQYDSIDNFNDLDGFASLIDACDFVVTADNSTIHLSSALGKKALLLLPYVANWRWSLDRSDSPWYPSIKLYRQTKINDWDGALQNLNTELKMIDKLS